MKAKRKEVLLLVFNWDVYSSIENGCLQNLKRENERNNVESYYGKRWLCTWLIEAECISALEKEATQTRGCAKHREPQPGSANETIIIPVMQIMIFVCLFLSSLMHIMGYTHHPAPVAQSVRASYLSAAVLALTAEGAEVVRRSEVRAPLEQKFSVLFNLKRNIFFFLMSMVQLIDEKPVIFIWCLTSNQI